MVEWHWWKIASEKRKEGGCPGEREDVKLVGRSQMYIYNNTIWYRFILIALEIYANFIPFTSVVNKTDTSNMKSKKGESTQHHPMPPHTHTRKHPCHFYGWQTKTRYPTKVSTSNSYNKNDFLHGYLWCVHRLDMFASASFQIHSNGFVFEWMSSEICVVYSTYTLCKARENANRNSIFLFFPDPPQSIRMSLVKKINNKSYCFGISNFWKRFNVAFILCVLVIWNSAGCDATMLIVGIVGMLCLTKNPKMRNRYEILNGCDWQNLIFDGIPFLWIFICVFLVVYLKPHEIEGRFIHKINKKKQENRILRWV